MIYTESVLPDVLSRSSEMVEKARVEDKGGDSASGERSHIHHHLFVYIEATNHCTELFKGYPAVSVLVCIDNGLVHDLLELRVLQVVAYHHLQNLEELAIGDVAILVHVIDPKSNCGAGSGMGREQKHR